MWSRYLTEAYAEAVATGKASYRLDNIKGRRGGRCGCASCPAHNQVLYDCRLQHAQISITGHMSADGVLQILESSQSAASRHPLKQQLCSARETILPANAKFAMTRVNAHVSLGASPGALGRFRPSFAAWTCEAMPMQLAQLPTP